MGRMIGWFAVRGLYQLNTASWCVLRLVLGTLKTSKSAYTQLSTVEVAMIRAAAWVGAVCAVVEARASSGNVEFFWGTATAAYQV